MTQPFSMKTLLASCAVLILFFSSASGQNGLNFDGSNDYVQTGFNGITGNGARTVEAWIRPQFVSSQIVIADWGAMSPNGSRFTLNLIAGKLRCEVGGAGMTGPTVLSDGNWHHVAVVYDNGASQNFTLYVDGTVELAYNLGVATNTLSTTNFRIGRRLDNANPFIGDIDEVRVWDYARTQVQLVNALSAEFCSLQTGLVAYYKFNNGTVGSNNSGITSAYDASGNGNNGTLNGFSLSGSTSNWVLGYPLTTSTSSATISVQGCGSYTSPSGNYTWNMPGTYQDTVLSIAGCDSILTINLSLGQNTASAISLNDCESVVSPSGNQTWFASGTYSDTIPNAAGCDSVITINVDIDTSSASINATSCGPYTSPSGNYTWNFSGFYFDTLTNAAGCDSILGITLSIENATTRTFSASSCSAYTSPSGSNTWTSSGTYLDTIPNQFGCDSIMTINLTVTSIDTSVNFSLTPPTMTAQMTNANYQWIDCASDEAIPGAIGSSLNLLNQGFGTYAVRITKDGCSDTSSCYTYSPVGISEIAQGIVRIFPNPVSDLLSFESDYFPLQVQVFSLNGGQLDAFTVNSAAPQKRLETSSGIYLLEITDARKQKQFLRVVVE